jgi:hypothetical protein
MEPTVAQPLKKFLAFYGTLRFITVSKRAHKISSCKKKIQLLQINETTKQIYPEEADQLVNKFLLLEPEDSVL